MDLEYRKYFTFAIILIISSAKKSQGTLNCKIWFKKFHLSIFIIENSPVKRGYGKFVASIAYNKKPTCNGAVISCKHVVTIASCLHEKNIGNFEVTLESLDVPDETSAKLKISTVIIHPDFEPRTQKHNLCVLTVDIYSLTILIQIIPHWSIFTKYLKKYIERIKYSIFKIWPKVLLKLLK